MKYLVRCDRCGMAAEVEASRVPSFCVSCGNDLIDITPVRSKARMRAELAMARLETLAPRMVEAREWWLSALVEYEDEMQILRQYKKRGIVTEDEVERYAVSGYKKVQINEALKEYRAKKKERDRNG